MEKTLFEIYNQKARIIFEKLKIFLGSSGKPTLEKAGNQLPVDLFASGKKLNVVFAGQYSAGKSTILSQLTGKKLAVGGGITTTKCTSLEWEGIHVTDTPGIHTQNRPDHDAITYEEISKADLLVFVLTSEGFSDHLGNHFRKLLNEYGKGHEMMLVVNKMEQTKYGNVPEQQQIIGQDLEKVTYPYSKENLYVTFVSMKNYQYALDPKNIKYKERFIEKSGYASLIQNLNRFIADKRLLGSATTSLYEVEKILTDFLDSQKAGDEIVDGTLHLLCEQRNAVEKARNAIKEKTNALISRESQHVTSQGNIIASRLTSKQSEKEVNSMLAQKQKDVDDSTSVLTSEIEKLINVEAGKLSKNLEKIENSEFGRDLKTAMEHRLEKVHLSDEKKIALQKTSSYMKDLGTTIAKASMGPDAKSGFDAIFKTSSYRGSTIHKVVLKIGHFCGHKFKPWQAVRWTKNIGNAGRILGVVGSVLSIGLQIYNDNQEKKMEKQLSQGRNEIRTCFHDVANTIEMEYNKQLDCWVAKNLTPAIQKIDKQIEDIQKEAFKHNQFIANLHEYRRQIRTLITEIQSIGN